LLLKLSEKNLSWELISPVNETFMSIGTAMTNKYSSKVLKKNKIIIAKKFFLLTNEKINFT
jgi:hypothetical protein